MLSTTGRADDSGIRQGEFIRGVGVIRIRPNLDSAGTRMLFDLVWPLEGTPYCAEMIRVQLNARELQLVEDVSSANRSLVGSAKSPDHLHVTIVLRQSGLKFGEMVPVHEN